MRLTSPFNLPAPGRCQTLYFGFRLMQSPVFLVNSRLCLVSATALSSIRIDFTRAAPLLPKLRGQLAEFLNDSSPAHLSLLSQSTCVGFGYGRTAFSLEAFPGSGASMTSFSEKNSPSGLIYSTMDLPTMPDYSLGPGLPSPDSPSLLRHSFVKRPLRGTGLATCCPSATPLGLALGPALPWAD